MTLNKRNSKGAGEAADFIEERQLINMRGIMKKSLFYNPQYNSGKYHQYIIIE